tara:strand:- start:189 stop:1016 length:828 start_codon:yes stop_codon:yes gene_type:complete
MFENLLTNKLNIKFFKETNCYAFEIENFLSDEQYNALRENLPDIKINEFKNYNESFDNQNSQHRLKAFVTEVNRDSYDKLMYNNPILNEFVQTMKNPEFGNKIMKKFFFKILKSRVFDKKTLLKLIIRKNRSIKEKSYSLVDKLLYNDIVTHVGLTYMAEGAQIFPHTDGMKKILSMMLYFPEENISDNINKNLGTTFWNSNEFSLKESGKDAKVKTFEDSERFKKENQISLNFPFKKKNIFGFIKSHKSWHSLEPIQVHEGFIRKNMNINLLLI